MHAVLTHLAPGAPVVDLTHRVPPFDVRFGAEALRRAAPFLGPGVVLGVVDPGVGSERRGVAIQAADTGGPRYWVGPDNGLLPPAIEERGLVEAAVTLSAQALGSRNAYQDSPPTTFDGRDLFAPAVAALLRGGALSELGASLAPEELVRLPAPLFSRVEAGGTTMLRAEVTWVDHFGNVQLAAPGGHLAPAAERIEVRVDSKHAATPGHAPPAHAARRDGTVAVRVPSFAALTPEALGILVDANGRLALVCREVSAARRLGVVAGDVVILSWPEPGDAR